MRTPHCDYCGAPLERKRSACRYCGTDYPRPVESRRVPALPLQGWPGEARRGRKWMPLGVPATTIRPGEERIVHAASQVRFAARRLAVKGGRGFGDDLELLGIYVGCNAQTASCDPVPCCAFAAVDGVPVDFDDAHPGVNVAFCVRNVSDHPAVFSAGMLGEGGMGPLLFSGRSSGGSASAIW